MDPEIEYVNPPDAVEPGVRRGPEVFDGIRAAYADIRIHHEEVIDAPGDDVVVLVRVTARGRESGFPVEWRQGYVWTIRDGKGVRFRWFNRPEEALEAAGIADQGAS